MTNFTGTDADEIIRPSGVSGSVGIVGNPMIPSSAVDVTAGGSTLFANVGAGLALTHQDFLIV